MEKLIYRQGIVPRRVTLGGNISPMYSGCGTSLWTWEIHHPRISPQNESDSVWWLGTQKKRRSQKMDANHMQIRWDFGRPFQQDSRFKISGTGTGSETCHFFLAESKTFDFNTTICQHGSQDHRKPKKQTWFQPSHCWYFKKCWHLCNLPSKASNMSNIGGWIASISTTLWSLCRCKWVLEMQEAISWLGDIDSYMAM